jgi:hypothetical protein
MSFAEFGGRSSAQVPEHNRLRGLDHGNPHPKYAASDHSHSLGVLGYAEVTANQTGITTVATDLTDLTVSVDVAAGRRVRVSTNVIVRSSAAGDAINLSIIEGAVVLQAIVATSVVGGYDLTMPGAVVLTPSAGSHTYLLQLYRAAGTGTLQLTAGATYPSFILVEDIGAA